jgi:hypothetical protein
MEYIMSKTIKVETAVAIALVAACKGYTTVQNRADTAQDKADSKLDPILLIGLEAGTLANWDALKAECDRLARVARKPAALAMGYTREEVERDGNKILVTKPGDYLGLIFSTIRQTHKRGLQFSEKDGRGEVVRFSIKKLRTNIKADTEKSNKKATGRRADMNSLGAALTLIRARAKNYSDTDLHNFASRMATEASKMPTTKSKAA